MNKLIGNAFDKGTGWGILVTILLIVFCLALAFGVLCLEGWIVMLLWNAVAVAVFGAPTLSFWLSVGILLLCNILFKSVVRSKSQD
jgi:hypothetical protein